MYALKKYFALLLVVLPAAGCTYHEIEPRLPNTCAVTDPAEDLAWLRDMIASAEQSIEPYWYIQQGTYQGQTVFAFNVCCISCNYIVPVYNCSGVRVLDNLYVQGSVHPQVRNLVTIAKAENFKCS